jgi:hypothetical protein
LPSKVCEPLDLIRLYNLLIGRMIDPLAGEARRRVVAIDERNRALAAQHLAALAAAKIPPQPYVCYAYARYGWVKQPPWGKLVTSRGVRAYCANTLEAWRWWKQIAPALSEPPAEPPLQQGAEIVKARFRCEGAESECRSQPELSGGWHPQSTWCSGCPERERCREDRYRRSTGH